MQHWVTVLKAAETAAQWHARQRRKGAAQEPYINHLLEVAWLVGEATGGKDPDLVIAALLHDAIEDCQIPRTEIEAAFGADVAALVADVTDDKSLKKEVRKQLQIDHAPGKPMRVKILKLADKTSNLRAIAASPPADWPPQRRLDYVAWACAVAVGLRGTNAWLEERFDAAAADAEQAIQAAA
ncbi:HD domain-containing protein [Limobrevibacterium gyesilva]|uniref:HD domain-containing protein n=1 Tax=Limobrevibacterium gyesilva TaxID=2991712 RepID=A0AA41YJ13_9PROT|nr:HD domain-containing protein [Limobrevibacterium gyesilva]MCW3473430.1 HD domain-containing protein [Limobrevibacterium gyesilva]